MSQTIHCFDEFELDTANRILRRGGETLQLPARAFDVLRVLVENPGRLIGKDELFDNVWAGQIVEESNLSVQISQIRKALGESSRNPRFIETVPGYGYRFRGSTGSDPGLVESESFARVTYEREETVDAGIGRSDLLRLAAFGIFVAVLSAAAVWYLNARTRGGTLEKPSLSRLTNNGRVAKAAVSPDGKLLTYVLSEAAGNSLWVKQVGVANERQIVEPRRAEFWGLTFTPDGSEIYYSLFSSDKIDPELYRVPALGGVSIHVKGVFAHSISFSPDGKRFAYVLPDSAANRSYLAICDADGSNKRVVGNKPQPATFVFDGDFAAWSPDGMTIAVLINNFEAESNFNTIAGIDVESGAERPLGTRKWYGVQGIVWSADSNGIIVSGSETPSSKNRLWFVSDRGTEQRALTDDLNTYSSLGRGANGGFVAVQTSSIGGISATRGGDFREIVSEVGTLSPIQWTTSGKLIFRSSADGSPNLWSVEADGLGRRQLTAGANVDERGLCVTPDERFIVFVSWQAGKSNLWRVDADGQNPFRLTEGEADAFPVCMPDSKSVIFQRGLLSQPHLWQVGIEGGEPRQVTRTRAKWGAISPDGTRLSFFRMTDDKWRIGVASPVDGNVTGSFDVPEVLKGNRVRWSPDGKSLLFIGSKGNEGSVWKLDVNDGRIEPAAALDGDQLADFDYSSDGRLAVSRLRMLSDVVLIEISK